MINYGIIQKSIDYYHEMGYKRLEAPWWVSQGVMNITRQNFDNPDYHLMKNNKCLVASGEQSFLYMMIKGQLPLFGSYQAVTPCFRDESIDLIHCKNFIKNELITYHNYIDPLPHLKGMIDQAVAFFCTIVDDIENIHIVKTNESSHSYDINYRGYEVGSYGLREYSNFRWIYGTGCAEPRLSTIINMEENLWKL